MFVPCIYETRHDRSSHINFFNTELKGSKFGSCVEGSHILEAKKGPFDINKDLLAINLSGQA